MQYQNFETDFAVFRVNEAENAFLKQYKPNFSYLADLDFQNSQNFENESPFFIPQKQPSKYPLKTLQTLADWQSERQFDDDYFKKCFEISEKLIDSLRNIHQKKIAYGCLSANNILIDKTNEIWFSEWSFASNKNLSNSLFFESSLLNYLAPEQTNRKETIIDFRTDLYALGVILYQLFTQNNPFSSKNELDTIYKHRTFMPPLPSVSHPKMGVAMAEIILKLLEKNPENRFTSIESFAGSFEIAKQFFEENRLHESILSASQKNRVFSLKQAILDFYKPEIEQLNDFYQKIQQQNAGLVCLIDGKNGVQKSKLIESFFNENESENTLSLSISLKNDQQVPLASFRELLKTITQFYLTRPEDELLNFQNIVNLRLGLSINVLHEIYPNLIRILPIYDEKKQIKGSDLKSQLIFALAEFMKSFVQSQKKLLLHFRGFQFTTNNTLGVIEGILKELPLENLLFLFSFEKDLLSQSQNDFIEKISKNDTNLLIISDLQINSLDKKAIENVLIQQKAKPSEVAQIAEILFAKTSGLPFYLNQIIDDLFEKNKIRFEEKTGFWNFEKENLLSATNFSENLDDFYKKQYESLSESHQKILNWAVLIGENFQKNVLKTISEDENFEEIFKDFVGSAIFKTTKNTNDFSFNDSEFRNYCLKKYLLPTDFSAIETIIEGFLKLYPEISKSEYFYVFLNKILVLPSKQTQKYKNWIKEGFEISQKIADFDNTYLCSKALVEMISEQDWQQNQEQSFQTMTAFMASCSLSLKFDETEKIYNILKEKQQNEAQTLYLAWQYAETLLLAHNFPKCMSVCVDALKKAGINISSDPSVFRIILSSIQMNRLMRGKDFEFFKDLKPQYEEKEISTIRILQSMIGIAFLVNPKMIPELIYKQADYSLKNGYSLSLAICLACYAFMNANYQKKYADAKKYFDLAQKIEGVFKDSRSFDVNMFLNSAFIQPWHDTFRKSNAQLFDNLQHCRQTGYVNMGYYNVNYLAYHSIYGEENIKAAEAKILDILPYINAHLPLHGNDVIIIALRFLQVIGPKTEDYLTNYYKSESYEKISKRIRESNHSVNKTTLYLTQFYLDFLLENYKVDKNEVISCTNGYLTQGKGYYQLVLCYYYVSLNYVKFERELDGFETKYVKKTISELYEATKINTQNFESKALFIDGLFAIKQNQIGEGTILLQKALEVAIRNEQLLTSALIARELGKLQEKMGFKTQGIENFRLAVKYFLLYDAEKLADKILEKYPELNTKQNENLDIVQKIDLQSFINASTSISAEIKLENLLEKMMLVLAKNAGAEMVYFIVPNQSGFELIASKTQSKIDTLLHTNLDGNTIPLSILHYVMRSRQFVLLENASKNPIYKNDPYIRSKNIQSVLCLPVVKNNQTLGIIYFENNLLTNAFTQESTETLNLLASQIAISFENSQLYDNLENKVRERTNELMIEKDKSEKLLLNILPSEVANELKELGHSEARLYNHVTVLFADFVGFTKLSEKLTPKELIDEVDEYFKAFDMIMEEFGLEKIKTIGDAYLSVCGLPNAVENHAHQAAKASKAILSFIENHHLTKTNAGIVDFDIRIGLHSGSVIAGIVGLKKFAYDIWGDTVNTAARMEQSCEPNKINISHSTYELIKDDFTCRHRGKIEAKNKGEIDMYYLE